MYYVVFLWDTLSVLCLASWYMLQNVHTYMHTWMKYWACMHVLDYFICSYRLDYCGIAMLTMGSFVPWLYYSFYCRVIPMIIYLVLIFILGTTCIVVSMWDKFAQPKFRPVRAGNKSTFHFIYFNFVKLTLWCNTISCNLTTTIRFLLVVYLRKCVGGL